LPFETDQQALAAAHAEVKAAEAALRAARTAVDRRRHDRQAAARGQAAGEGAEPPAILAEIDADIAAREAEVAERRAGFAAARQREFGLLAPFAQPSPREQIGNLSDRIPLCLLPLRIETRFKPAGEIDRDRGELWLRVYPDDISVDTFEDTPSETEARDARTYWAGIWAAGGDTAAERGAWAAFAGSQGAGRSHWVTTAYAPLNPEDQPVPPAEGPWIILTIPTRAPLPQAEEDALAEFWRASWRAADDLAAQTAALDALTAAVGAARAAELSADYVPVNLADPPPGDATRAAMEVIVAVLEFPTDEAAGVRLQEWSTTPRARLMPDRLVFMGWTDGEVTVERVGVPIPGDLAVAPDPLADEDEQMKPDGADIDLGDELAWVRDFDQAVAVGMGFRIPLDAAQFRRGFDRVLVMGVRLRSDAEDGRRGLEQLITCHNRSKGGFSILPQGRPTNNVETDKAGYSWREDPDVSFDHYFGAPPPDPATGFGRTDGRRLAEALGLDPAAIDEVPFYGRTDIGDAEAMNVALWPGTAGYFCESMLHPVLDDATIRQLREFFTAHVTARGAIPAIRVGRQPYGILPATPRSRLRWLAPVRDPIGAAAVVRGPGFPFRLYQVLRQIEADFEPLIDQVGYIGKQTGDPHKLLLDIVGLHPGSVEFQQRYAESLEQLYNRLRLEGAGGQFLALINSLAYAASGVTLLQRFGYDPTEEETPAILEKFFTRAPNLLTGPLIDDVPLSETAPIRAYTAAGENYLAWLREAAATSHDALRKQEGFAAARPNALLYHMLRHALDLSYVETSLQLYLNAGLMTEAEVVASRREPAFLQVGETALDTAAAGAGSRWQPLYRREAAITGLADRRVGDFIPTVLNTMAATAHLSRQLAALDHLRDRPTLALERCLAEHLDLLTYRLDAWYGGLMSLQLAEMRRPRPAVDTHGDGLPEKREAPPTGLHLGAWGWLEEVRPEARRLDPVELTDETLVAAFDEDGAPPLMSDSRNQGYIHAPSLNHAVTAAVLRNGYLSNATPDNPGSLAVNLTSERVRRALRIIEGLKADQNMAALLGYEFERGVHDNHDEEIDAFIYDLRKAFPLAGDRLRPTRTGRTDADGRRIGIRQVEARNLIDGLEFVKHLKTSPQDYPFGLDDMPEATPGQAAALGAEARRLLDLADAVADLAMAESVHQVVQGNYDRAGAVLDTYSKGKFPSTPDVIRTPRSGVNLTHRIALHLETGLNPADPARLSPRARAEPALDAWVGGILPDLARIAARVDLFDREGAPQGQHVVSLDALGLAPIDLVYLLDAGTDRSAKALDDLIEAHVVATHAPRPDFRMEINYRDRLADVADHVPVFELMAMIRPLRTLVVESRPLRPTDMSLAQEAAEPEDLGVSLDTQRIVLNRDDMDARRSALAAVADALEPQVSAEEPDLAAIASGIDAQIDAFVAAMIPAMPFAQLESGTNVIFGDRARAYAALRAKHAARVEWLDGRLAEFDAVIAAYDADTPPGEEGRIEALILADRLIFVTETDPQPADAATYRTLLTGTRRPAFVVARDAFAAIAPAETKLSSLHDAFAAAILGLAPIVPEPIDLDAERRLILALAEDMAGRARTLSKEMAARVAAVTDLLTAAEAEADPRRQVEDRIKAARLIFGEEFQIVPEFTLPVAQGAEWRAAWGPGPAADQAILDHQMTTLGRSFPVDDFLIGLARVREKVGCLEAVGRFAEAFGTATPALEPLQFPNRPGVSWLALDYPNILPDGSPLVIDEDKLLYTGHFAVPFDETRPQAALLIDEITETIPSVTEDTGLALHYDRPNSEPPQAILLCLPPVFTGGWCWDDLVDCVVETMDLARKRAIEPDQVDDLPYGRFLPAVVSAVTLYPITAAINFAETNGLSTVLATIQGSGNE
jgi:hypothetical protein